MRTFTLSLIIGLLLVSQGELAFATPDKTIYLVRHAEKVLGGIKDPALTKQGQKRAQSLAAILNDQPIQKVYSTDYKRTKQTAAPIAKALKLETSLYNPRELKAFAEQLIADKQNALVVGHSNTTPMLAFLLGGDSFGDIDESQYERLYKLEFNGDKVTTQLLPFPPLSQPAEMRKIKINQAKFQNQKLTYRMSLKGKPVGKAVQSLTMEKDLLILKEDTQVESMKIDAQIEVHANAKTLAPVSLSLKGSMGSPAEIALNWSKDKVKGFTQMPRAPYKPQGKVKINQEFPSTNLERTTAIMMAHLLPFDAKKPYSFNWFDGYSGDTRAIQVKHLGVERVTVPAGSFNTRKLELLGGAPSQVFYISQEAKPKVVKIEVISMPWVYELLEVTTEEK